MRIFHAEDGLFFERNEDGSVTIRCLNEFGNLCFEQTVSAGSWVSAVLTMSAFDERGGDFWRWMTHHMGTRDLMGPVPTQSSLPGRTFSTDIDVTSAWSAER